MLCLTEQGREFLKRYGHFYERYVSVKRLLEALSCEREQLARMCERPGFLGAVASVSDVG